MNFPERVLAAGAVVYAFHYVGWLENSPTTPTEYVQMVAVLVILMYLLNGLEWVARYLWDHRPDALRRGDAA